MTEGRKPVVYLSQNHGLSNIFQVLCMESNANTEETLVELFLPRSEESGRVQGDVAVDRTTVMSRTFCSSRILFKK